jgi:hypothetical protein
LGAQAAIVFQGRKLLPDGHHEGQRDSYPPPSAGLAGNPVNRESIAVWNGIRNQIKFLAIEPDVPLPGVAQFAQLFADERFFVHRILTILTVFRCVRLGWVCHGILQLSALKSLYFRVMAQVETDPLPIIR